MLSIKTLHEQGWSQRRIARELGINRESVAQLSEIRSSKPAKAPRVSTIQNQPLPTKRPPGLRLKPTIQNQPFWTKRPPGPAASANLTGIYPEAGLSKAFRPSGFTRTWSLSMVSPASYPSVRRYRRSNSKIKTPLPFRRIEVVLEKKLRSTLEPVRWSLMRMASVAAPMCCESCSVIPAKATANLSFDKRPTT